MSVKLKWIPLLLICMLIIVVGCKKETTTPSGTSSLLKPAYAVELPVECNTPDGMVVDKDGNILLAVLNYNDRTHPAKIVKIDKNDKITDVIVLPKHPETGTVSPLGIEVGPNGHLYIADNQAWDTKEHKSRLLKVTMENGKALKCESVVEGFVHSNAVSYHKGHIYVTETFIDNAARPMPSGVYRFKMEELDGASPVKLEPGGTDKHLIVKFMTDVKDWDVGANGLGFSKDGNKMYVCNFGEASILEYPLDADGNVTSETGKVLAQGNGMESTDGIKIHPETGDIYVADFVGNAIHKVDHKTGKVTTIAQNGDSTGAGGELDKCSEVCIRGNKIYAANIDLPFGGNTYDEPYTLSVFELK